MKRLLVLLPLALAACTSDTTGTSSVTPPPPPGPTSRACVIDLSGDLTDEIPCTATLTVDPSGAPHLVIIGDSASQVQADLMLPDGAGSGRFGSDLTGTVTVDEFAADASEGTLELDSTDPAHGFYGVTLSDGASGFVTFQASF